MGKIRGYIVACHNIIYNTVHQSIHVYIGSIIYTSVSLYLLVFNDGMHQ
jgi:hypothetical protein